MAKAFFVIVLLCVSISVPAVKVFAAGAEMISGKFSEDGFQSATIDQFDTVVFDLSQAVITGNLVAFPILIHSDDTIFSLDFSLKYDHTKLEYDTIYDLTNYMQSLSHYNSFDSTVRFTSSSFQQYTHDTVLAVVQFILNSGGITINDIYNVEAYLNGITCSAFITDPLLNIDSDFENDFKSTVFPNPTGTWLNIQADDVYSVRIFNTDGAEVYFQIVESGNEVNFINLQNLCNGIYLLEMTGKSGRSLQKFIKAE